MVKELIFVLGSPYSGRTTWIYKNLFNPEDSVCVDANSFSDLYVKADSATKDTPIITEESLEKSRQWALNEVKANMESENPTQRIILSLIGCRPDRWREFLQLAVDNEYDITFKNPTNKLFYYNTKHNTYLEQYKYIESKVLYRYPRDKKQVLKKNSKNPDEASYKETNESSLLRNVVTEFESAYAFYIGNRMSLGNDKTKWLDRINEHYKSAIANDIKKVQKKIEKEVKEAEKAEKIRQNTDKNVKVEMENVKVEKESEEQNVVELDETVSEYVVVQEVTMEA
jgi:hypothetical protein